MSARRGKVLFVLGAVVFGAVAFQLAAAYLIERDQPKWLAAAVGALAFPVLPVVWQIIGEHRRKSRIAAAKLPPKQSLAPGDRYVLRAIAVTALVLGPMLVIGRFAVVRAAWTHKTWFLPDPTLEERQAELLAHVPSDAEAVILLQGDETQRDGKKQHGVGVFAYGDHQLAVLATDDGTESTADKVKQFNDQRDKIPFLKLDAVEAVDVDGYLAAASARWAAKVTAGGAGPSADLRAELARAPADAKVALALVPTKSPERLDIKRASAWLVQKATNEKVTIGARVECTSPKAAEKLVDEAKAAWKTADVPAKCRDELDKLAGDVKIDRAAEVLTLALEIPSDKLFGLMLCAMKDD